MSKYKSKPVEIEAVQVSWKNWEAVCDLVGDKISKDNPAIAIPEEEVSDTCDEVGPDYIGFWLETTHGEKAMFRHGDYVIPDARPGTFYPCKPDIFDAKYELVED
jgi:hypothetical protein